jgi:hypothetical protein
MKPATRAGFKSWSGRQDAPLNSKMLYFNMLISSENPNSPNLSLAPVDLKEPFKRITTGVVIQSIIKIKALNIKFHHFMAI